VYRMREVAALDEFFLLRWTRLILFQERMASREG
jgi:hypothetical protein